MSSAICASAAAAARVTAPRVTSQPRQHARRTSVRARVATERGAEVGDGVYNSDEVVRPLTYQQKDVLLQSLAADLENSYAEVGGVRVQLLTPP
jgi:hypothetical protein